MNIATHCKFCQKPITVAIDDDYAKMRDPFKLLPLASCNRCADLRVDRWRLDHRLHLAANRIIAAGKMDDEERQEHAAGIAKLLKQYAQLIARWYGQEGMLWDDAMVDSLMGAPEKWPVVVKVMWDTFRQWQRQQEAKA